MESEGIELVCAAMRAHTSAACLQQWACHILANLAVTVSRAVGNRPRENTRLAEIRDACVGFGERDVRLESARRPLCEEVPPLYWEIFREDCVTLPGAFFFSGTRSRRPRARSTRSRSSLAREPISMTPRSSANRRQSRRRLFQTRLSQI